MTSKRSANKAIWDMHHIKNHRRILHLKKMVPVGSPHRATLRPLKRSKMLPSSKQLCTTLFDASKPTGRPQNPFQGHRTSTRSLLKLPFRNGQSWGSRFHVGVHYGLEIRIWRSPHSLPLLPLQSDRASSSSNALGASGSRKRFKGSLNRDFSARFFIRLLLECR